MTHSFLLSNSSAISNGGTASRLEVREDGRDSLLRCRWGWKRGQRITAAWGASAYGLPAVLLGQLDVGRRPLGRDRTVEEVQAVEKFCSDERGIAVWAERIFHETRHATTAFALFLLTQRW